MSRALAGDPLVSASPSARIVVRLLVTERGCTLCERTQADLERLQERYSFRLERALLEEATTAPPDAVFRVPIVYLNGIEIAWGRIEAETLAGALRGL